MSAGGVLPAVFCRVWQNIVKKYIGAEYAANIDSGSNGTGIVYNVDT